MKKIFSINFVFRFIFLMLTPVFFQFFAIGFIWHSIYWGVITLVVIIWGTFIVISPLFGRIGCGWFCFMGTCSDFASQHSLFKLKWHKPKLWIRIMFLIPFFVTSILFFFLNKQQGLTHGFQIIPSFVRLDFSMHYKYFWIIDILTGFLLGILLERRWACKNVCFMGTLCSVGAKYSRLIPVVDTKKCTECGKCEKECLVRIPIIDYIKNNSGLVINSECILCGKCVEVCKSDAIKLSFVWNRKKYIHKVEQEQEKKVLILSEILNLKTQKA